MDRPTYLTKLASIEQELPKLANTLNAMKITDTVSYGKIYEELSLDAAQRAEKITCSLRSLIFAANLVSKPMLLKKAADIQGITITLSSGIVQVTLPGLMPKKAKYSNTAYLTDPLYTAFELYVKEHPLPHFKDCVVSFLHIYDASLSAKRVRDYDNLDSQECKRILDTVACFLLTDDSGIFCDTFHRTEFGNKISALYTSIDNRLVNISSFYESVDDKLSRRLNDNDSKIMTESNERIASDQLLQSSIESISNQILSITEGLDDYKSRRELLDREVSSHFDNIDGKLDKIDIDHLTTKVNHNQEISMSIQHHSILTMDFLIRTSRMMVISFVSLIFTMIAMLIVIMTPSLGLKIASGIFGIICAAFVVYEAKYIINSIKKAKLSLDDLIKDSYE